MKTPKEKLQALKQHLKQTSGYADKSVDQIRDGMREAARALPTLPGIQVVPQRLERLYGEWVKTHNSAGESKRAILYFHGGGFVAGTCELYRDLAGRISDASSVPVLTIEYRLAPEYPYPAANEDCLNAYHWMLGKGYTAEDVILGGDSVGATLALMTLIQLRGEGEKLPAGAFLLSPHSDLVHLDGESYEDNAGLDPTGSREGNQRVLADYWSRSSTNYPAILSPLRLDLKGIPPLLIQVGDQEVLLSDALRLAERGRMAGMDVTLEIWEDMWSVHQFMAALLPEGKQAIQNIGSFTRQLWNG